MLTDFDQITLERILTPEELQRFIYRLIEDLNFRIRSVENEATGVDITEILKKIPEAVKGDDGVTYYTWIKYSPNSDGSNMTNLPTSTTRYIGIAYNNLSATESDDPSDYIWAEYKGADGRGIVHVGIEYGKSDSEDTQPSDWDNSPPDMEEGEWLWVKTLTTYSDSTTTTTYQKSYVGTDGHDGVSVYVQGISRDGNVTTITMTDGTTIEITDGTDGTNGVDGKNGYVHIAWANSADGTIDFSNVNSSDKTYIGVYTNSEYADSENPSDYNWSLIKGDKGDKGDQGDPGVQGVGVISIKNQYYSSASSSAPTDGGWSTDVPAYDPNRYLWVRLEVEYDNGEVKYTDPVHDTELDAAFQKLSSVEGNIGEFETTIGGLIVRMEGHDADLLDLENRMSGAESGLGGLTSSLADLNVTVSGQTVRIGDLEVSVEAYEQYIKELRDANSQLSKDLAERTAELNDIIERFENYVADEGQYMSFDADTGLTLGAEDNQFKTVIDNQRMAFMDGTAVTAYVSGQMFNMNNAVVRGSLKRGGYEEQIQADGSVRIIWVGV